MSKLFDSLRDYLAYENYEAFIAELEKSDVSDITLTIGQPMKCKLTTGEYLVDDAYEITETLVTRLTSTYSFNSKNRAVVPGTLHRVSGILDSESQFVGITFRVSRTDIYCGYMIKDLLENPQTTLLLGKPGSGKTTFLREIAYILSQFYNVILVDKSNEIAGDDLAPNKAIGNATVMRVPFNKKQSDIITEAIENHNPDIILVDEISDYQQAEAVKEAASKGVVVFATMHGDSLKALVQNPIALKLLGGFSHSALGDKAVKSKNLENKTTVEQIFPSAFKKITILKGFNECEVVSNVDFAIQTTIQGQKYGGEYRQGREGKSYVVVGSEKILG